MCRLARHGADREFQYVPAVQEPDIYLRKSRKKNGRVDLTRRVASRGRVRDIMASVRKPRT